MSILNACTVSLRGCLVVGQAPLFNYKVGSWEHIGRSLFRQKHQLLSNILKEAEGLTVMKDRFC